MIINQLNVSILANPRDTRNKAAGVPAADGASYWEELRDSKSAIRSIWAEMEIGSK
jgi:hypothetical protein